jgi:hypothetical protein
MKRRVAMRLIASLVTLSFLTVTLAFAASKTYQVTGPVLEVKDDMVVVQKGKEKWEIAKDKDTKVTGDLKVGSKVTVTYTMKAAGIESKGAAPDKAAAPAKKK